MKITCETNILQDAVNAASELISEKMQNAVLKNIAFVAKNDRLEIFATNLEVTLRIPVLRVDIEKEGSILLDAGRFSTILANTDQPEITIENKDNLAKIYFEGSNYELCTEDYDHFPNIESFGNTANCVSIPYEDFKEMVVKTHWAAAKEKGRYAINGILCKISSTDLTFVATDKNRLAVIKKELEKGPKEPISDVIPTQAMRSSVKLSGVGQNILLKLRDNKIFIKTEKAEIYAQLVSGKFPPWEKILASKAPGSDKFIEISTSHFTKKLNQASIIRTKDSNSLKFSFDKDLLTLSARAADVGSSKVNVNISYDVQDPEDAFSVAFNPKYISEGLSKFSQDRIKLKLKDGNSPAIFEEENGLTYIVMPIFLS
jgi:DNA polymerase III subunit beta